MEQPSGTASLARLATELDPDDTPPAVLHQAARLVFDSLICMAASTGLSGPAVFEEVFTRFAGTGDATLIPSGTRVPVPHAAFVNAMAGNARDLDDNLLYHCHIASTVVAAALATGELVGADGRALLAAVVAGYEVASRVVLSIPGVANLVRDGDEQRVEFPNPWGHSSNIFGATAAAGRLLGLDAGEMTHAFGIAGYSTPVPSMRKAADLAHWPTSKVGAYGWQAHSACLAALLASRGMTGDETVLDGPYGFWKMVGAREVDREALTMPAGEPWWIMSTSFKLEAAGTWMRPAIALLQQAMSGREIALSDIQEIIVDTHPVHSGSVFHQRDTESYLDAMVSYPYLMAVCAAGVPVDEWNQAEVFTRTDIVALTRRVHVRPWAKAEHVLREQLSTFPRRALGTLTRVTVRTCDAEHVAEGQFGRGDPFDPSTAATDTDLEAKFDHFGHVAIPRAEDRAHACELVWALENDAPVAALVAAFCRPL